MNISIYPPSQEITSPILIQNWLKPQFQIIKERVMSNPIQLKNRYQHISGRDAERTFDTERLLKELKVPYTLNNRDTHIIASFEAVTMHIWSTTMKWRVGEERTMQGTRAALNNAIHTALKQKPVEAPFKTEEELDHVKKNWLSKGGTPPSQIEGFERYQKELVDFYHRTQVEVTARVDLAVDWKVEEYLTAQGETFETLKLHQTMDINPFLSVTKVVGGRLYTTKLEGTKGDYADETVSVSVSTTFVPDINGVGR